MQTPEALEHIGTTTMFDIAGWTGPTHLQVQQDSPLSGVCVCVYHAGQRRHRSHRRSGRPAHLPGPQRLLLKLAEAYDVV